MGRRVAAQTHFWRVLEAHRQDNEDFVLSFEKNFGFFKNNVCIWGKMGYNKVE